MDYMDSDVLCPQKADKLNLSLPGQNGPTPKRPQLKRPQSAHYLRWSTQEPTRKVLIYSSQVYTCTVMDNFNVLKFAIFISEYSKR